MSKMKWFAVGLYNSYGPDIMLDVPEDFDIRMCSMGNRGMHLFPMWPCWLNLFEDTWRCDRRYSYEYGKQFSINRLRDEPGLRLRTLQEHETLGREGHETE